MSSTQDERIVYICYRHADGLTPAQWLQKRLHGRTLEGPRIAVFFDATSPAVADHKAAYQHALEAAHALIFVATPGAYVKADADDWVHRELEWWIKHRKTAPIVVDTVADGERCIPQILRQRWPHLPRILFCPTTWDPADIPANEERIVRLVMEGIALSGRLIKADVDLSKTSLFSRLARTLGFRDFDAQVERRSIEFEQTQSELNQLTSKISDLAERKARLELQLEALQEEIHKDTPMVFLSYAREDNHTVRKLYCDLRDRGMRPWLDLEDLLTGDDWDRAIRRAIWESDFVVICVSTRTGIKRGYIQREIRFAIDCYEELPPGSAFLLPIRLEDCDVPEDLRKYQYTDLFNKDGLDKLATSILSHWAKRRIDKPHGRG